ncbi:MAG: hypothetical protein IJP80_01855 [Bacteroidales bacterium]|nr:hypothetical protein [Bacteroidales bacterium]
MTIVADSGSTKTTWVDIDTGNKVVTDGLNPHFTTDEQILTACHKILEHFSLFTFHFSLYFYSAGCGNAKQRQRMEKMLSAGFRTGMIHVGTDMLGACRAVSGGRASIVAILGTGSNACYYDGDRIKCQPTSTGYVMGDNGSANHVGRILLNDYLTQRMPREARRLFHDTFQMSDSKLVDAVYHQPNPNRFLASLAPFAVENEREEYCGRVISEALYDWYHGPLETLRNRSRYRKGEINLVGGFAKAIEHRIRDFFTDDSLHVGTVVADPIEGLAEYHRIKNS